MATSCEQTPPFSEGGVFFCYVQKLCCGLVRVVFCGANFGLVTSYAVPACPAFLGDLPGAPLPHSECLVSSSLFNLGPQDCAAFLWTLFSAGAPLFVKD